MKMKFHAECFRIGMHIGRVHTYVMPCIVNTRVCTQIYMCVCMCVNVSLFTRRRGAARRGVTRPGLDVATSANESVRSM